jgi:hypothetical protein
MISISSLVIAAWRARFICSVSRSIICEALRGRLLAGAGLEQRVQDAHLDQSRQQVADDLVRAGLEHVIQRRLRLTLGLGHVALERQDLLDRRHLRQRRAEVRVEQKDRVELVVDEAAHDLACEVACDARGVEHARHRVLRDGRATASAQVVESLATDAFEADRLRRVLGDERLERAVQVRVVAAAETAIARHVDEQHALVRLGHAQQRVHVVGQTAHQVRDDGLELLRVRTRCDRGRLCATQLRRGDHLHRLGDLLRAAHRADALPDVLEARHLTWWRRPA